MFLQVSGRGNRLGGLAGTVRVQQVGVVVADALQIRKSNWPDCSKAFSSKTKKVNKTRNRTWTIDAVASMPRCSCTAAVQKPTSFLLKPNNPKR